MIRYNLIFNVEILTLAHTIIDLLFITNDNLIHNVEFSSDECCSLISDHKAITCELVLRRISKPRVQRVVYDYAMGDFELLIGALEKRH